MIVLENIPSTSRSSKSKEGKSQNDKMPNCSADPGVAGGSKPQKGRSLDCSTNYVLVSCHLELLRHSLSSDLHLTQVRPCQVPQLTCSTQEGRGT